MYSSAITAVMPAASSLSRFVSLHFLFAQHYQMFGNECVCFFIFPFLLWSSKLTFTVGVRSAVESSFSDFNVTVALMIEVLKHCELIVYFLNIIFSNIALI